MHFTKRVVSLALSACVVLAAFEFARADPPGDDPEPPPPLPPIEQPDFPRIEQVPVADWQMFKCCVPGFWTRFWPGTCEPGTCHDQTPCGGEENCAVWVNGECLDSTATPPPSCAIVAAPGTIPPKYKCVAQICKVWRQDEQGAWYVYTGVACKVTNNGTCPAVNALSCHGHPCS